MERRFSSVQAMSVERGYYRTNDWFGRQAAEAAPCFSSEAYCHFKEQKEASNMDLCSTSNDDSTAEEDASSYQLNRSLCEKNGGRPINIKTDSVTSRALETGYCSPSVIARLMGLDEFRPQTVSELKSENGTLLSEPSFSLQEKFECRGNQSFHVSRRKHQNFEIVHGLYNSSKSKDVNLVVKKKKHGPNPDMAFIKQQFMQAYVSTNEALRNSKEFNGAVESSPVNSREEKGTSYITTEKTKGYTQIKKDSAHSYANTSLSLSNHSTFDYADSLLPKLLRLQYAGRRETSNPTSIVVLKPSVQKMLRKEITEPCLSSLQKNKPSRRLRGFHRGLFVEREEQHKLFYVNSKSCKTKASPEIARDISTDTMQSSKRYSSKVLASGIDIYNPSSTYLTELPLSGDGDAMNSLSERWRTKQTLGQHFTKKLDKVDKEYIHSSCAYTSGISGNDWKDECDAFLPRFDHHQNSSTLFGSLKTENGHQVQCFNPVDGHNTLKDMLNREQNDLNHSIMDRGHSMSRNFKNRVKNREVYRSRGVENKRPVTEVEMGQKASRDVLNLENLIEPKPVYLQRNMDNLLQLVHNFSMSNNFGSDKSFWCNMEEFQQSVKYNDLSVFVHENEVASIDIPLVECPLDITHSGAFIEPKTAERLSPVSVLDTLSEDGKSHPECLDMIRADLQSQYDLLDLETFNPGDDKFKPLMFNDVAGSNILKLLKDGDGRDLMYLLDILTVSGFYVFSQNNFFNACYLSDNPVFPDVFDKLERKYSTVNLWSRSERRLLFDHINSVLADVLAPCLDLHPWVKLTSTAFCGHNRLINETWRLLVQRRKELCKGSPGDKVLDTKWLYVDDHVDMIGREIERMLKDDLLNELVSEFFGG